MGILSDLFGSAMRGLANKATEIQNNEAKYSRLSDDAVMKKMTNHSATEKIAAKRVLEDRGYQFKKDN